MSETDTGPEPILKVVDLRLHYFTSKGAVRALDGLSFELRPGETLGLVGESGCGKTTTGLALLGMVPPPGRVVSGSVEIDGTEIVGLSDPVLRREVRWSKISMVFQGAMNCLTPVYTIGRHMLETLHEHREMDDKQAVELITEYLSLVGLPPEIMGRYPHELSGGMKQRVVIATALFLKPKIVILDEPTTALDVIVQAQIINLLKKLKSTFDLSFIFITHDLALEAEVADRLCVMYAGKIAEIGPNETIYGPKGPSHPYTERLLQATPLLHKKVDNLSFIPGTPPDLIDPPKGCRFNPRCHKVFDKCYVEEPPLIEIEPGHQVACWRATK
jgi:peptide/nickel transport system ATP-binding protein